MKAVSLECLELACYGMTDAEIAKRHRVQPESVQRGVLVAARHVGRLGFWKFDVSSRSQLVLLAPKLLAKMDRYGLRVAKRVAA